MASVTNDIIRVAARQLRDGSDEVVNVMHLKVAAAGTGGDSAMRTEVAEKLSAAWLNIQWAIPNNQQASTIDMYNVTQDYPLGQVPWGSSYVGGSNSGDQLPAADCALLLLLTDAKRVQGKVYFGALGKTALADGVWNGTLLTDLATWFTDMIDSTSVVDDWIMRLGIYSRGTGTFRYPTGRRIVSNPAVQKRRRTGRGS